MGFALAIGFEGHPYSVRFIIVFGLVYLINYFARIRARRRWLWDAAFWAFVAGGFSYLAIYIVLHVAIWANIDIVSAFEKLRSYYDLEVRIGGTTRFPTRVIIPTRDWFVQYLVLHPAEAALALLGLLAAVRRNSQIDRLLLALFLPSLLLFFLIFAHFNTTYWIHNLPFVALFGGSLMAELAGRMGKATSVNFATVAGISALVTLLTLNDFLVARQGQDADRLIEVGREIDLLLPPEIQRVAGWQIYYFGLSDREFYDILNFTQESAELWLPEWGVAPPQALILTQGLDDQIPNVVSYIESGAVVPAQCFDIDLFEGVTVLYLMPEYLPDTNHLNCEL